jgi:hypothetical protein
VAVKLKSGGVWKDVASIKLKSGGVWKNVSAAYLKVSGAWKIFFGTDVANEPSIAQTVTLTTNSSSMPATLTGTNYRWTNATVLTYKFQYYSGSQWLDGNGSNATGVITNPSVGSSNTKTYTPIAGDFPSNTNSTVSFRFIVTATNTNISPSLSTSSTSNTVDIYNVAVFPAPTQTLSPGTPSGTGQVFTSINKGSAGTYTNSSSKTRSLVKLVKTTTPTDGSNTAEGTLISDASLPYTITQPDATTPQQSFYTRDNVVGLDGNTYYYYSSPLTAYVAAVSDSFNRTAVASGLGTSTSSFIYSSYANRTSSWSTNGSSAINSTVVSFDAGGTSYPLQTIEVGTPNRSYALSSFDGNSGGVGVAYWVTSAGSWWATIPSYYYSSSTTTTTCSSGYGTFSDPSSCNGCSYTTSTGTTLVCTGSTITSICEEAENIVGGRCSACTTLTNYYQACPTPTTSSPTYSDNTIGTGCGDRCSCLGPFTGSSTTYICSGAEPWSGTLQNCNAQPNFGVAAENEGRKCGSCVRDPITSRITYPVVTPVTTSTTYYHCTTRLCSNGYSYSTLNSSNTTLYSCYTGSSSSTATTYYSRLKVFSSVSGSVSEVFWTTGNSDGIVSSSTSGYNKIYSHTTTTSGNTITAIAYNVGGTQMGSTLSLTASNPTKANANGETSVGLIKGPTDDENGSTYSDWQVSG